MSQYKGESNMFDPNYVPRDTTHEHLGMRVGPGVETEKNSGFEAYGKPVPIYRRIEADKHLKQMCGDRVTTEERSLCIGRMVNAIERDEPEVAFHAGMRVLDLTGTYRLLAVLLCHEEETEVSDTTFLDLVDKA